MKGRDVGLDSILWIIIGYIDRFLVSDINKYIDIRDYRRFVCFS